MPTAYHIRTVADIEVLKRLGLEDPFLLEEEGEGGAPCFAPIKGGADPSLDQMLIDVGRLYWSLPF